MNIIFFIDSFYLECVKYHSFVVTKSLFGYQLLSLTKYFGTLFNEYRFLYYSDVYY